MAKRDPVQAHLRDLAALEVDGLDDDGLAVLRRHLCGKSGLLIARCARVIATHRCDGEVPGLVAAFAALMVDPIKRDPQCRGKIAIVETLHELNRDEKDLYLAALRHVQLEPVYGGRVDTAGALRGKAGIALACTGDSEVRYHLVWLLADREAVARSYAARALAMVGGEASELLLRLRLLDAEKDPEVIGDLCAGLLAIDAERALPFLAGYVLEDDPVIGPEAAYAIGQSRCPSGFPLLREAFERRRHEAGKRALLLPLFLLRNDAAYEWLAELQQEAEGEMEAAFAAALEPFAGDDELMARFAR